jgi:ubiquinone/menaquinone biosynthesis C-methylase UbiE
VTREVVEILVPKYAKGRTLDVGGGTSKYRGIIKKFVSNYLVADLYETEGVDFREDARKMSFPDESFDTVLSFQVLEHIDDTTATVREMYRVLKRGGGRNSYDAVSVPPTRRPVGFSPFYERGGAVLF